MPTATVPRVLIRTFLSVVLCTLAGGAGGGAQAAPDVRINSITADDQAETALVVDESGRVHVTFLDRRDDPANVNFALYLATSSDGGATFAPNVRVSDGAFPRSPNTIFVGDYNATDSGAGRLHAIWADGRNGDLDVFTEAVVLPGP